MYCTCLDIPVNSQYKGWWISSRRISVFILTMKQILLVKEKIVVIHLGRCNNKVFYRFSHNLVTGDGDCIPRTGDLHPK